MKTTLNILQLQYPATEVDLIGDILIKDNLHFEIVFVDTKEKYIQALISTEFDVILYNDPLPLLTAGEALDILKKKNIKVPFILVSSPQTDLFAAAIFKAGAADYILKDELYKITAAIKGAIENFTVHKELENCTQDLKAESARYLALTTSSSEAVIILSAEGKPSYVSANVKNILGYTPQEVLEMDLLKLAHPDDLLPLGKVLEKALANPGIPVKGHTGRMLHKDKTWRWIEATVTNMLHDPAVNGIVDNCRDVTDQKNADEKIVHLNRMYAFISQVNQAISHSKNKKQALKKICKIAVNTGKFKAAWIGFFDYEKKKINLVESVGIITEDLSKFRNVLYNNNGPQEMVLRTKRYYVCNNIQHDFPLQDWKDLMAKRGYEALIVLPILKSGAVIATFNLYASEIDFFTEAEIALLVEATGDISFALDLFEKQQQKLAADELVKNKELHLSQAQAIAHLGSWELDFATGIAEWSDELLRIYGIPATENKQTRETWIPYVHPEDREKVRLLVDASRATKSNADFYHRIIRKDGVIRYIHTLTHIELDADNNPTGLHGVGYDVTEMKQTEEALRESEADLRAIFENTSDGFILCDINGIIKSFNSKARDRILLNIEQEVTTGKSIFNFLPGSRKKEYKNNILKVRSGEVLRYDYPYTRKNGETKWFNFTVNPVYHAGQVEGISITSTDITERKKAEEQLKESELFNKDILGSLSSHIAVIDRKGTIIAVNKAWDDFARENGVTTLERVSPGSNYFEVCKTAITAGDIIAGQALKGIKSVFKKENQSFEFEYPCHSPIENRWFTLYVSKFGNDDSKLVVSHNNITERKKAENKLNATSLELESAITDLNKILDSSLDVICTINGNGEFEKISTASQQVWGYTPEELIGTKIINLVYHEDVEITIKAAEKLANNIQVPIFENRYVHKNGKIVPMLWSIKWDDELQLTFCIAKDVTEKKRLEKAVEIERDQFFEMFSKAPSAIAVLKGPDHVLEMVNEPYLQLIGRKDVIGKTVVEIVPEVIEQGFVDLLDKVYSTGESYTGSEILVKLDKEGNGVLTDAYLNFIYQAYRNNEGHIKGVFFFANDITEQIVSRKEIEKSEKFFKGVIENSDDMLTITDAKGKTLYASPAVSKKLGYTNAECLKITIWDIIHPDDTLKMQEFIMNLKMHPGVPMEWPLLRERKKDGSYIWIEGTLTNFLETEGINAIVANFRDVTERKIAHELLVRSEANLNAIIENTEASIYSLDRDLRFIIFNNILYSSLKQVFGLDIKPGDSAYDFLEKLSPGEAIEWKEVYAKAFNGETVKFEKEFSINDYHSYVDFSIHPIWENKNVIGLSCFASDITKQKKADEKERFKANLLNTIGQAAVATDINGVINYWNKAAENMYGWTKEEAIGKNIIDLVPSEATIEQATQIMEELKKGHTWSGEFISQKKDKTNFPVFVTDSPIYDQEGKQVGIIGISSDITEKKKLENLLDKSNRLARIGSWEIDVVNNDLFWSDITKEIREVPPDFVPELNDGISYFKEGGHKETISQRVKECIENGTPWDEELQIITYKGNYKWVRTIGEGEFQNGKCIRVYGSFQDIDERKKAETSILKAYEEKNSILESIGDAFFAVDKNSIITYWNNKAEIVMSKNRDEVIGKNIWEVFNGLLDTVTYKHYQAAVNEYKEQHYETFSEKLGKWLEVSAYPSSNGLTGYFRDITDRKLSDLQLSTLNLKLNEHVKDLATSNKELEQFAYVASHDLQEPLRMVTSFLTQIEKKYTGLIDAKGKKYIHFAMDGAKRMRQIILDLLEFSRVGQTDDKIESVNLNELVKETLLLLRRQVEEKNAVIKVKKLPVVKTLKSPLRQVFQNLISNSLLYNDGIKPEITIGVIETDHFWQLSVTDNGIGIDAEYFDKIFTIFQRLHNKDDYSGTGIGLAISKKIIEGMGGKIWVESKEGKGSTFYFTLPK
ncbi:MAG: PAS domain S-box protein [Ferruginibacter sp.]